MTAPADAPRPVPASELGDFATADRRMLFLLLAALAIGVAAAFIAAALFGLIGFFTNLFYYGRLSFSFASPADNQLGVWAIGVPVLGGLIVGLIARFGSERIRGHGIPEALEAILIGRSRIEPKVTVLKPVATAISIGSGGPFGAEGPVIMTGGALGSVLGQFLRITASERRTLLVAGAAAGMAATFNTPLAAVLLSVELLLFEWKPRSLIPVGAAVCAATVVRWPLLGSGPLFPISGTLAPTVITLGSALVVGVIAGLASLVLTWAVYASEDRFRRLPVHWMWWPAIGGVAVGVGGLIAPRALGVGYVSIDALLLAELSLSVVLTLLIVKAAIWAISLGSGTSGGVLAPLLLIGGSMGCLLGMVLPGGSVSLFVLVGMGAMIGGTMRAPFTGVVFSLELTHDLPALLPLLVAALAADAMTVLLMRRSILTEKVARRGVHVAREYSVDPLERVPVRSVMRTSLRWLPASLSAQQALEASVEPGEPEVGLVLVDDEGRPLGLASRRDLAAFVAQGGDPGASVRDRLIPRSEATYPDEPMREATTRLLRLGGNALPVDDPSSPGHFLGFVTRESALDARAIWNEGETTRERWLALPWPISWSWPRRPVDPPDDSAHP